LLGLLFLLLNLLLLTLLRWRVCLTSRCRSFQPVTGRAGLGLALGLLLCLCLGRGWRWCGG
jgi:hypothetical protein